MKRVFLILFLVSCRSSPKLIFTDLKVGVHQKLNVCDLIDRVESVSIEEYLNKNTQANAFCIEINTTRLGLQKHHFLNREFYVEVVDEISPEIKIDRIILKDGDNLEDIITVVDNHDVHPFVDIKGEYDLKKDGTYSVEVIAVDQSGNRSKKKIELQVQNDLNTGLSDNQRRNREEFIKNESVNLDMSVQDQDNKIEDIDKVVILGIKDITITKGSSMDDLIFYLSKDIQSDIAFSIDFSKVNVDVSGAYSVEYLIEEMVAGRCMVFVLDE